MAEKTFSSRFQNLEYAIGIREQAARAWPANYKIFYGNAWDVEDAGDSITKPNSNLAQTYINIVASTMAKSEPVMLATPIDFVDAELSQDLQRWLNYVMFINDFQVKQANQALDFNLTGEAWSEVEWKKHPDIRRESNIITPYSPFHIIPDPDIDELNQMEYFYIVQDLRFDLLQRRFPGKQFNPGTLFNSSFLKNHRFSPHGTEDEPRVEFVDNTGYINKPHNTRSKPVDFATYVREYKRNPDETYSVTEFVGNVIVNAYQIDQINFATASIPKPSGNPAGMPLMTTIAPMQLMYNAREGLLNDLIKFASARIIAIKQGAVKLSQVEEVLERGWGVIEYIDEAPEFLQRIGIEPSVVNLNQVLEQRMEKVANISNILLGETSGRVDNSLALNTLRQMAMSRIVYQMTGWIAYLRRMGLLILRQLQDNLRSKPVTITDTSESSLQQYRLGFQKLGEALDFHVIIQAASGLPFERQLRYDIAIDLFKAGMITKDEFRRLTKLDTIIGPGSPGEKADLGGAPPENNPQIG